MINQGHEATDRQVKALAGVLREKRWIEDRRPLEIALRDAWIVDLEARAAQTQWVLGQVMDHLPSRRDWLDPVVERMMVEVRG